MLVNSCTNRTDTKQASAPIISPTTNKNTISLPISIPKASSYDKDLLAETQQYTLNAGMFNPSKMSPPDHWKSRLEQRIKEFYNEDDK